MAFLTYIIHSIETLSQKYRIYTCALDLKRWFYIFDDESKKHIFTNIIKKIILNNEIKVKRKSSFF